MFNNTILYFFITLISLTLFIFSVLAFNNLNTPQAPSIIKTGWLIIMIISLSLTSFGLTLFFCNFASNFCQKDQNANYFLIIFLFLSFLLIIVSGLMLTKYNEGNITYEIIGSKNKSYINYILAFSCIIFVMCIIGIVVKYYLKLSKEPAKVKPKYTRVQSSLQQPVQPVQQVQEVQPLLEEPVQQVQLQELNEEVQPAVRQRQSQEVQPAVRPRQSQVQPSVPPRESQEVQPAVRPIQSQEVQSSVPPRQSEEVQAAVRPMQSQRVRPALPELKIEEALGPYKSIAQPSKPQRSASDDLRKQRNQMYKTKRKNIGKNLINEIVKSPTIPIKLKGKKKKKASELSDELSQLSPQTIAAAQKKAQKKIKKSLKKLNK